MNLGKRGIFIINNCHFRSNTKISSYDVLSKLQPNKKKDFHIACYKAKKYSDFISNRLGLK